MLVERIPAPTDPLTGIVRPIFVTPDDFPDQNSLTPGTHTHHLNFNKKRLELQGDAGKALRHIYAQQLPEAMHHATHEGSVHWIFSEPEELPSDITSQHRMIGLIAARAIPREAIKLNGNGYEDKYLSDEEYAFVSSPKVINVEASYKRRGIFQRYEMGSFFIKFAMEQDLDEIATSVQKNRFLRALKQEDCARVRELGNLIIYKAIEESLRPIRPFYEEAKRAGMVSPQARGFRPSIYKLIPAHEIPQHYDTLATAFTVQQEALAA